MSWTDDERRRFEAGTIELLIEQGVPCEPTPGSLRITMGGPTAVATWASRASGKLTQHHGHIEAAELARILQRSAERLRQA